MQIVSKLYWKSDANVTFFKSLFFFIFNILFLKKIIRENLQNMQKFYWKSDAIVAFFKSLFFFFSVSDFIWLFFYIFESFFSAYANPLKTSIEKVMQF